MEINAITIEINNQNLPKLITMFNELLENFNNNNQEIYSYEESGFKININNSSLIKMIEKFKQILIIFNQNDNINQSINFELNGITITSDSKRQQNWLKKFSILLKYYEKTKSIDVPFLYEFEDIKLGRWVDLQRSRIKNNDSYQMSNFEKNLLNIFSMKWSKKEETWEEKYQLLKEYYQETGNINLPQNYTVNGINLLNWLNRQKSIYNGNIEGVLTENQISLLNELKIIWNISEENWDRKYYLLEQYYKEHGNTNVPRYYEIDGEKLWLWLNTQMLSYYGKGKGKITKDHIQLLNDLNHDWNPAETKRLHKALTANNKAKYYEIVERRINHILDDLTYEGLNEIDTQESQKEIEDIVIKRLFR